LKVKWLDEAEEKDYAAARSYLSLLVPGPDLDRLIDRLKKASTGSWRAKDILRATSLPLLGDLEAVLPDLFLDEELPLPRGGRDVCDR